MTILYLIELEVAFEDVSIRPLVFSKSMLFAVSVLSCIPCAIRLIFLTLPMILIILKITLVSSAILQLNHPIPTSYSVFKLSQILVTLSIKHGPFSVNYPFLEHALILASINPVQYTIPMNSISL